MIISSATPMPCITTDKASTCVVSCFPRISIPLKEVVNMIYFVEMAAFSSTSNPIFNLL